MPFIHGTLRSSMQLLCSCMATPVADDDLAIPERVRSKEAVRHIQVYSSLQLSKSNMSNIHSFEVLQRDAAAPATEQGQPQGKVNVVDAPAKVRI